MVNTQIRSVRIVGTGLIGASWAAQYLASGFDVVATDPAPNAEADLRKRVDEAWELLTVIGLASGASRDRLVGNLCQDDIFCDSCRGMQPPNLSHRGPHSKEVRLARARDSGENCESSVYFYQAEVLL